MIASIFTQSSQNFSFISESSGSSKIMVLLYITSRKSEPEISKSGFQRNHSNKLSRILSTDLEVNLHCEWHKDIDEKHKYLNFQILIETSHSRKTKILSQSKCTLYFHLVYISSCPILMTCNLNQRESWRSVFKV